MTVRWLARSTLIGATALIAAGGAPLLPATATRSDQRGASMTDNCSAASASATEISKCFGLRIESLTQIALPDQWYFAKGTTLAERFRATFNAMPAGPDKPSSVAELMARFDNHGEPMAHTVWLNQPLSCPQCNDAGADGFYTVLSVRNGVSVMITALEMHMALTHQGRFPDEKLALLHRVFAPVTVAH